MILTARSVRNSARLSRLSLESLEDRTTPAIVFQSSATDSLIPITIEVLTDANLAATVRDVKLNGRVEGTGNQLVFSADVTHTGDIRQYFVIDTNGFMRFRHYDFSASAGQEDPFGTSVKLPLGLWTTAPTPFLSSEVQTIDIDTSTSRGSEFTLVLTGRPADGPSGNAHNTAPVSVQWTITLFLPLGEVTEAQIDTVATFEQQVTLDATRANEGQAFRIVDLSSSVVPDANTTPPLPATHDFDHLRILSGLGAQQQDVDMVAQADNTLVFGNGTPFDGVLELNQLTPAPLNADPPNVAVEVLQAAGTSIYSVNAYKTVGVGIDENSDNVGVWINRSVAGNTIAQGTQMKWSVLIAASDDVLNSVSHPPPILEPFALAAGAVGASYHQTITTWTGPPGPYTFTVTAGTLPAGLTLSAAGTLSGTPTAAGASNFTITATNQTGQTGSQAYTVTVSFDPPITDGTIVASGPTNGTVLLFNPNATGQYPNTPTYSRNPFGVFAGNIRSATGDVNGDGTPDTIYVSGPGTPIRVTAVSGVNPFPVLIGQFDPFGGNFMGGGFVTADDIDHDGRAEFAVTPDQGGGPRVTLFSFVNNAQSLRANFFGIDDPNFRGGARSAFGDVNGDTTPDLIVSAGFLGGPRTALFNGTTLFGTPTRMVGDFFAFPGTDATTLRNGVFVASGDVNGDGFADLIFGGGPGGAPRVFILSGALVSANSVAGAQAAPIANFFVGGNTSDRGGVRVAAKDSDGDVKADVVVGSGEGSAAKVRIYLGLNITGSGEPAVFQDIAVFGGGVLPGGVFVG